MCVCVCVGEIISLPWFSKELKNNYLRGFILILLVRESIFVGWGFSFPIVLEPRYKLSLCHTPIKPDLLGFPGIGIFVCGLLDHVFKRFALVGYVKFNQYHARDFYEFHHNWGHDIDNCDEFHHEVKTLLILNIVRIKKVE